MRDYFATRAMQSTLSEPEGSSQNNKTCARNACRVASAMLAARGQYLLTEEKWNGWRASHHQIVTVVTPFTLVLY